MEREAIINLLHLLHYATRLPVHWLVEGKPSLALPGGAQWAGSLLQGPGKSLAEELDLLGMEENAVFYASSAYEEQFIGVRFGENHVLLGPFGLDTLGQQDVTRLVRALRLRLDRRDALRRHYEGLVLLSQMNAYYVASLLEQLLIAPGGLKNGKPLPLLDEPIMPQQTSPAQGRVSGFRHPPLYFESEITRCIRQGNLEEAMRLVRELNTMKKARLADSPMRSLQNSLICAITLYTRAAIQGGVQSDEAFTLSDTCIQLTERQQTAASLLALEEAVITRFTQAVVNTKSRQYTQLVRKALALIDEELTEPLSAAFLAQRLFVHPDYLASRFKEEVGETLHTYILRRRVLEAANFMRYSEESISGIAAFYRFSSQSHFTAVFKRFQGMTPARYRKL